MDGYFKQLQEANIKNEELQKQLNELKSKIGQLKQINTEINDKIEKIYSSRTFKLAEKMRKILKEK